MNKSITEGMKRRKQIIEYAIKEKNNAKAARKYHVTRQYIEDSRAKKRCIRVLKDMQKGKTI